MARRIDPDFIALVKQNLERLEANLRAAQADATKQDELHNQLLRGIGYGLEIPETAPNAANLLQEAGVVIRRGNHWRQWVYLYELAVVKTDLSLSFRLRHDLGQLFIFLKEDLKAEEVFLNALHLAQANPVSKEATLCTIRLAEVALRRRNHQNARQLIREADKNLSKQHTLEPSALLTFIKGQAAFHSKNYERAIEYFQTAYQLWDELKYKRNCALSLNLWALSHQNLNNLGEALRIYHRALALADHANNKHEATKISINMSALFVSLGSLAEAENVLRTADRKYLSHTQDTGQQAMVSNNLGFVLFKLGRFQEAIVYFEKAQRRWTRMENQLELANTLGDLGRCYTKTDEIDLARTSLISANKILRGLANSPRAERLLIANQKSLDSLTS